MRARTIALRHAPAALALLLACAGALAAEEPSPVAPYLELPPEAPLTETSPAAPLFEMPFGPPPLKKPAEPEPETLPAVSRFNFAGNDHFSSRSLRHGLETHLDKPIVVKTLKEDVDHIILRYADDGYLEAKVKATFEPYKGKPDQELLFTITEGRRFTLKQLEIVGNTVFPAVELRALAQPERDGFFSKGGFLKGARSLWAHYGETGRLTTVVTPEMKRGPAATEVSARYVIAEGPPVTLQTYSLKWINKPVTADWIVYREADRVLRINEPLTLAQIEKVTGRLKQHRWFKSVNYEIHPGDAPDRVKLVFLLEEGETSRVSITGTAATYFGLSAAVQFTETDFDVTKPPHSWDDIKDWNMFRGRGESLSLLASPGQRVTTIGGNFAQPYTFGTDNNLVLGAQYTRVELPGYNEWQWQVRPGLTRQLSDHWSAGFGPTLQGTELFDLGNSTVPDYAEADGYTPGYGAWGRLSYSTTAPGPVVNRGVRAGLSVDPMYEDNSFLRSVVSATRFFPLHGEGYDAHVFQLSAQGGQILGNAPVFERFYCGGLGSVRGFDVWGISPQYQGTPIGGFYYATASAEYTLPLFHLYDEAYFRGAAFVDAGDAETRFGDLSRIRVGSGVGLRVILPKFNGITAGVNFGWPVKSYRGDSTLVFTFFLGTSL